MLKFREFNPYYHSSAHAATSKEDTWGHTWPLYAYEEGNRSLGFKSAGGPVIAAAAKFEDMHLV